MARESFMYTYNSLSYIHVYMQYYIILSHVHVVLMATYMYSIMTLCIIYSAKPLNIVQCYTIMHLSIVCDVPFIGYNTVTMFFHRSAKTAPLGLTPPVSAISQMENLLSSQAPPKRYIHTIIEVP